MPCTHTASIVASLGDDVAAQLVSTMGWPLTRRVVSAIGPPATAHLVTEMGANLTGAYWLRARRGGRGYLYVVARTNAHSLPCMPRAAGVVHALGIAGAGELVRTFGGPMAADLVAAFGPKLTADIVDALGYGYTGKKMMHQAAVYRMLHEACSLVQSMVTRHLPHPIATSTRC